MTTLPVGRRMMIRLTSGGGGLAAPVSLVCADAGIGASPAIAIAAPIASRNARGFF
jgi:hypothetical protein